MSSEKLEEGVVLKSGPVLGGISPLKSKKSLFCVLRENVLELHVSEKSQKRKKPPKFLIDLATCVNVNRKLDTKLKYCVSIMTANESFLIRSENEELTDIWNASIIEALIPARALRLKRPVHRDELFECAWDVTFVKLPDLQSPPAGLDAAEDLCARNAHLCGEKRLCFYPHSVIILERGRQPSVDGAPQSSMPPFSTEHFFEFQCVYVASVGRQENYFFMRIGRSAQTGSGVIWVLTESGEVATDMYHKLSKILEREFEKKKELGNTGTLPTMGFHSRTGSSSRHGHRPRTYTHFQRGQPSTSNTATKNTLPCARNSSETSTSSTFVKSNRQPFLLSSTNLDADQPFRSNSVGSKTQNHQQNVSQ